MTQIIDIDLIYFNEVDNDKYVYLYLEDDCWCAYERSAYYLVAKDFPVTIAKEVVYDGCEIIMKASFNVDHMRLPLIPSAVLITVADDRLLFQLDKPIDGFVKWKRAQIGSQPA
nr:hypothetical protein [Parabacteroides goldsteinii]